MVVNKSLRKQGIGAQLLKKVEEISKKGCYQYLVLDVSQDNSKALKFFENQGFKIRGFDELYIPNKIEYLMVKSV